MEDVLGCRGNRERFDAFLANWESILMHRVAEAVESCAEVEGVCGLVLAGSVGRSEQWPLSDIDLLPIYDDGQVEAARAEIERRRVELVAHWATEGWWTGLDIGKLMFTRDELARKLAPSGPNNVGLLQDDRWYYSLDKGYRGRAVHDPSGLAGVLAKWFTEHRFSPPVVQWRLTRTQREVQKSHQHIRTFIGKHDPQKAANEIRFAAKWLQAYQLERWGERDTSQGRIGTRFERLAIARNKPELVDALRVLNDLNDAAVEQRMAEAPDWVWERHDRSWTARRHVGEHVSRLQDARDSLRVCALYEMGRPLQRPFPNWLGIRTEVVALDDQAAQLTATMDWWFAEQI